MKPAWAIKANGKDVTQTFKPFLLSIRVRDESKDEADSLTITLDNSGTALNPPTQGDELEILLGYDGDLTSMGKFVVDKSKTSGPPDVLTIDCKSAAFAAPNDPNLSSWLTRKTRSWEPGTLGDIAKKVAAEHGVELVAPADVLSSPVPHVDQTEESDTSLLYRLATPSGYVVKVADRKLILVKRSNAGGVNLRTGKAIPAVTLARGDVSTYSAEWMERAVFDKAVAGWHDPSTGQTNYETAGDGTREFRFKNLAPDQATAKQWAAAVLKQSQGEGGKMSLTMPGRTDLQSEQSVNCVGFPYPLSASPTKAAIAKRWVLKSVEHNISTAGFTTSVSGEPYIDQ